MPGFAAPAAMLQPMARSRNERRQDIIRAQYITSTISICGFSGPPSWPSCLRQPRPRNPTPRLRRSSPATARVAHNAKLKTGGLVINVADLERIPANAETWEKVVAKLEGRAMPPAQAPRPDEAGYNTILRTLTTELDRAAAANPNPGKLPLLRRLTRTEYQNAIRDLLGLDALPKEYDISYLLPQDNMSSGFDNIADLLFMPPATLDRYLDAARKIARLAVGDPAMPVMVNIHRMDDERPQDARAGDLPFGTRGGLAIHSYLAVDATYAIKVELASQPRDLQELEITVDGERVQLWRLGEDGAGRGRGGRGGASSAPLEFRLPLKAGPKLIGVAFVQRSDVRDEATLRPRMRSRGTAGDCLRHDFRALRRNRPRRFSHSASVSLSAGP